MRVLKSVRERERAGVYVCMKESVCVARERERSFGKKFGQAWQYDVSAGTGI